MPWNNDLVFVTYTETPSKASKNTATRDLVRRQALKAYYSSQGSDQTSSRRRESLAVEQSPRKKNMHRFRIPKLEQNLSTQPHYNPTLTPLALAPRVSAFDPFVSSLGPSAWELIEYFRFCFRMKSMSISETREWFQFAMFNRSLSQATLSLVSLNRDLEARKPVSAITLHHRSQAMKLLQQEIDDSASRFDREVVAGTVALLTISEDMEGNKANAQTHMDGMVMIVDKCGGLVTFSENQTVMKLIAWADLLHASTWLAQPHLSNLFLPLRNGDNSSVLAEISTDKLMDPIFRHELEKALCPHLRSLIDILHKFPKVECPGEDNTEASANFDRMVFIVEQLMLNLQSRIPYEGYVSALSRAFIVAAQLYVAVNLKQTALRSPMVLLLTKDLMSEMELYRIKASRNEGMRTWNNVVLWIQTVGGLGADVEGNGILAEGLAETMAALGISEEGELVDHLSSIAWTSGLVGDKITRMVTP